MIDSLRQLIYNADRINDIDCQRNPDLRIHLQESIFLKEEAIMDRKQSDSLDESLKEKPRNCKSDAEMQKIIASSGMQELSVDMLEGVSGGAPTCNYDPSETFTVKAKKIIDRN